MSSRAYLALLSVAFLTLSPASAYDPSTTVSVSASKFYVAVQASATACATATFPLKYGSMIIFTGLVVPRVKCKAGAAVAETQSELRSDKLGMTGTVGAAGSGKASGESISYDTIKLIPPKGFKGGMTTVIISDGIKIVIQGNGLVYVKWTISQGASILAHPDKDLTKTTFYEENLPISVRVPASGTTITIKKYLNATAHGAAETIAQYITAGEPYVGIDKNWKCERASGLGCPGPAL